MTALLTRLRARLTACWRCAGRGYVLERGRRLRPDELTAAQHADQLINGGWHATAERRPCPRCSP